MLNKIYQKLKISNKKDIGLIDLYKVKPINKSLIKEIKKYDEIITVEEQWTDGGFGSAILEFLNINQISKKIKRYGLEKKYYFENGGRNYLHNKFGLNIDKIIKDI